MTKKSRDRKAFIRFLDRHLHSGKPLPSSFDEIAKLFNEDKLLFKLKTFNCKIP